ncbi:DUF4377 domain-containing protein [Flagellimonas meridianipacifica]|uniref:Uncharacterized protein DUF4377 n=1 Tax=Flagellimonas meridianipacifica TaxID=1080225 RepID=A0A2T0MK56_9FLAO|nr:DUF4377 domain-containing protein [Allomuricauda pacifica]PRX57953.1 uncharacterized protein DUF4377 [Allomuricauda pacifica]
MAKHLYFILFLTSLCFLGCSSDDSEEGLINLRVNYFTLDCTGAFPTQCLQVQEGDEIGGDSWFNFFDPIENFDFEPGFIYDLRVERTRVDNPPPDGSSFRYQLIQIVSRTEVSCEFEEPATDLEWLRIEIERRELNINEQTKYCYISQAEYEGEPVFLYFDCNPVINKVIPVLDCLGTSIGFLGDSEIDQNELSDLKIIWQPDDFACFVTQK